MAELKRVPFIDGDFEGANVVKVDRRDFLRISAFSGGGLILGTWLPGCKQAAKREVEPTGNNTRDQDAGIADEDVPAAVADTGGQDAGPQDAGPQDAGPQDAGTPDELYTMEPSVFVHLDSKGVVTVFVARTEMGQGVRTALAQVVADALDADWSKVQARGVVARAHYGMMSTGGSMSVRYSYGTMRKVGATARAMLVTAAAAQWKVGAGECTTEAGEVVHAKSGKRVAYGELVKAARELPVPTNVKPVAAAKPIVGTPLPRVDSATKLDGSERYAMDVRLPGMLFAVVERPLTIGGKVKSFKADAALAVAGVQKVVKVPSGVAVVAKTTWAAMKGRAALQVSFDAGPNAGLDDAALQAILDGSAKKSPASAENKGNAKAALAAAATKLEAVYHVPFVAHAPMEPFCAVADVSAKGCSVWAPSQGPQGAQWAVAKALGLSKSKVDIHTTLAGGRFGSGHRSDFVVEAAQVSKAVGAPVQVIWTRADDTKLCHHRPFSRHLLAGGLDSKGGLQALSHIVLSPSITDPKGTSGLDSGAVKGVYGMPYKVPNVRVGYVKSNTPVPIGWWRSVHLSQNTFAHECFIDELAAAAKRDPLTFRSSMMPGAPRLKAVLQLAADKSGWSKALPKGSGRGIACVSAYGSHVAMVAEVQAPASGKLKVKRVVCAVDCGKVLNPDGVAAQMEGCVAFGLSAALYQKISFAKGVVTQSNYGDFPLVDFAAMPAVEVHLVKSDASVGGVGELGVPTIAPAVVNAVFAATGKRHRSLPILS